MRTVASFAWRSCYVALAVASVTAAMVVIRVAGVLPRRCVVTLGPVVRRAVPLGVARSLGPLLPLFVLTASLGDQWPRVAVVIWSAVGVMLIVVYAVGLRRESWIARFEPEYLPRTRAPLGYRPRKEEDLRVHFLLRMLVAYGLPLTIVLATQEIEANPAVFVAIGFAIVYVGLGFHDYEICTHWDMHAHVLDGTSTTSTCAAPVARAAMDYLIGPLYGYIPTVYELNHLSVHHRANAGDGDPHSPLAFRRSSFLEFCVFATTVFSSLAFLAPFGTGRVSLRSFWLARAHVVATWAVVIALVLHGNLLGLVLMWAIVRHGVLLAADQIMWHGLVDPDRADEAVARTTLWVSSPDYVQRLESSPPEFHVPRPDEAWPFFDNLHLIHHVNSRIHFREYESELSRRLTGLRRDGCVIMAWRRMDSFVLDCWSGRFDALGEDLLTDTQGVEAATFIRRHLDPVPSLRSRFAVVTERRSVRRLDAALGRGLARVLGSGYS